MTQIHQQNHPLFGLNGPAAGNGTVGKEASTGGPAFAQWLNQSSQQLQAKALPVATPPVAAKPQVQAQAQMQKTSARPQTTSAQEENRLSARNAVARQQANRAAETPKPQAKQPTQQAEQREADAAVARTPVRATGQGAVDESGSRDKATGDAASETGEKEEDVTATGSPTQQILALLRGDLPQDSERTRVTGQDDKNPGDIDLANAPDGQATHGKRHDAGAVLERQQIQLAQRDALQGQAAESADRKEALQALSNGAHDLPTTDRNAPAGGPPQSFEAMLASAQQAQATTATSGPEGSARPEAPTVPLSQPLDSPEFAPELSASVSLLIKDGIHEAQLQLNPTDMGPVSIQIQMDGQQAQVNFHAEQAATREALERSLPDLAAALQNQGVTLSGGGVFAQQPQGGQGGRDARGDSRSDGRRSRDGQDDGGIASASRAERRAQPRGLVDLYA